MARELDQKREGQVTVQKQEQDPLREMIGLRDTINGMFEDFFSGRPLLATSFGAPSTVWAPPVDIRETDSELIVYVGLLGVKKEECKVEVKDDNLILSGARKEPEGGENWLRRELPVGEFYRAFTLPTGVNAEQVKARYADGILEIRLPKAESAKSRSINIE